MTARRLLCLLLYFGPLLAFAGTFLWWGSGERGRYETTWHFITRTLAFLCPEFAPDDTEGQTTVSLYQLNGALRRLAHVGGYAILTALIVRAVQGGAPRLKGSAFAAAVIVSVLYCGLDELRRAYEPNRHAKAADLMLNLMGVAVTLSATLLFFTVKAAERRLEAQTPEKKQSSPPIT